jgi:hypothetical protein
MVEDVLSDALVRPGGVVVLLTWCPSRHSSPCTLRYPQPGFSRASRSTKSRISWLIPGRPNWFG